MRHTVCTPALVKVFEDQGQLTVEIRSSQSWKTAVREVLLLALLVGLAIQFLPQLFVPQAWPSFAVAAGFLIFLSVLACKSVVRFSWYQFGQEEIVLRAGTLSVVRRLGYLGWSRIYLVNKLRDLHTAFQPSSLWAWRIYRVFRGNLGFSYHGAACHFADRLTDEQARELLKTFRHWLPESSWTPVLGLNK